ncbi:MAG: hypothetical protein ACI9WS_001595, partial [Paraglaciecola psychrophila]
MVLASVLSLVQLGTVINLLHIVEIIKHVHKFIEHR